MLGGNVSHNQKNMGNEALMGKTLLKVRILEAFPV